MMISMPASAYSQAVPTRPIDPPPYQRLALEQFAVWEYGAFLAAAPLLRLLPAGDGHPVLVLPGFGGSDQSTAQLRVVLRRRGHATHGWGLGRNLGPHEPVLDGLTRRLLALHDRTGRSVSLVGWSLGGIYARELAYEHSGVVRQVITLGAPFRFRDGDRGNASALYDLIGPPADPFPGHALAEHERPDLEVPSTSIYTRTDGIVRWHACIDRAAPLRENIEVRGTHSGLGYNVAAAVAVADRLAQPEGAWKPFRPALPIRHLFPRPANWKQSRRDGQWAVA
jgi:pimeloyl-ACP methyl ester carboxylesterase